MQRLPAPQRQALLRGGCLSACGLQVEVSKPHTAGLAVSCLQASRCLHRSAHVSRVHLTPLVGLQALPKDKGGAGTGTSAEWRQAIQKVDTEVRGHLRESVAGGFDEERFGTRIGFGNLRRCAVGDST